MARFLVEILIEAAGGPKARAAIDDVGAGFAATSKRVIDSGLQIERSLRRTTEAAARLTDQMEDTKASKGLITDLGQLNTRLQAQIAALKGDSVALARYTEEERQAAQAQRILTAQVKAGVSAQSLAGKEIADQIRLHDRLQTELHQTAQAHNLANRAQAGSTGGTGFSAVISSARSAMGTVTAVIGTLVGLGYTVKKLTDAASESEAVMAQLEAGVRSTGMSAGLTVDQLSSMADEISRLTGKDDELIASGEAILLTFTKISGDVFPKATAAALDMSVRMKTDLNSAIVLVGKALNDPIKGVTALSKSGVQFDESQKKLIKSLVESGDLLGAQTIILRELETQFGGSARAARDTLGGALEAAKTESGNLVEVLAGELSPVIRDLTERYIEWAQSAEAQQQMSEWGHLLGDAIRGAADAAELLGPPLKIIGFELKAILAIGGGVLGFFGWLADKVAVARDQYVGLAHDAGLFKGPIVSATPEIKAALNSQMDAVFALREEYGKLGQAAIDAARDQLTAMEGEAFTALTQAQKNRELLASREATRKRNTALGQPDSGAGAKADAELLRQTIELEKHGANLNNIITRTTLRLNEHATAAGKAGEETEKFSSSIGDAQAAARKLLSELLREVEGQKGLTAAAHDSASAHKDVKLAQEQAAKVEQIRTAFIKANLEWTEKQTAAVYAAVKALRDLKTEEEATLKSREMMLQITVDTSSLDKLIANAASKEIELDLKFRREAFDVNRQNKAEYDRYTEEIKQQLQGQAEFFRQSLVTPRQAYQETIRHINALADACDDAGRPLLSAAEAERLRADAARRYSEMILSDAVSIFSQLADAFGGFFNYLSRLASTLQQMQQTSASWSGMASNLGASAGTASMFGAAGSYFVAAKAMYDYYKSRAADREARRYDHAGFIARHDGQWWDDTSGLQSPKQRGFGQQLQRTIDEFVRAIGGSLDSLASVEVKVRRDGKYFEAWVQSELIGRFDSIEEATQAALLGAFQSTITTIRGLDPLVQAGLDQIRATPNKNTTLDEAQDFLSKLNEISEIGFPPAIAQFRSGIDHINSLREALAQLDPTSQAVIDATIRLDQAQRDLYDGIKYQLLGVDTAASEGLKGLAGFLRGMEDLATGIEEGIKARLDKAQRALDTLGTGPSSSRGGGAQGEGPVITTQAEWDAEVARLKAAIERYKQELGEIPKALSKEEINLGIFTAFEDDMRKSGKYAKEITQFERLRVDLRYKELKLQLIALGAWTEWAKVWEDLYGQALKDAGRQARGGGGGTDRKGQREGLRDELSRLEAQLKGPVHAAFVDYRQSLDDWIKRAKEAKLSLDETARGVAALTAQFQRSLLEQARGYAGVGTTDFTRRLSEMQKFFDELEDLGRGKTGIEDWRRKLLEQLALDKLGAELQASIAEFAGLSDPMLVIQMQAAELRTNLLAFAQAAGWSAEQIAAAQADINAGVEYKRQQGINGLLSRLFGWLKEAGLYQQEALDLERQNALLDLQLIEAQLRFYGALTQQTQEWIAAARKFINSSGFGSSGGGSGDEGGSAADRIRARNRILTDAANARDQEAEDRRSEADDILKGWADSGKPAIRQDLDNLAEQFRKVTAVFGTTETVLAAHARAYEGILRNHLGPIMDYLRGFDLSSDSSLSGAERFAESQNQFRALLAEIAGGDFTRLGSVTQAAEMYRKLGQGYTAGEGFRFIEKEIKDALGSITGLVPGLAPGSFLGLPPIVPGAGGTSGFGGGGFGSSSGPVSVLAPELQRSIETGNTLLLTEARSQTFFLTRIDRNMIRAVEILSSPLSVRNVA